MKSRTGFRLVPKSVTLKDDNDLESNAKIMKIDHDLTEIQSNTDCTF